ncbi:TlpA family protein disulfide reductase [Planctomyces sp. SH-PL14]|uniref:TlpA family protein disulfide reductase n=1 Tax=Planctomyces sp. SH-PL14 TaxID=1632864 RepID=UPI00078C6E7B|nr:TlpA disulfide reductase family protein [Planctomyces sp. SH-PL14]AMV17595.1 Thiol-disulfide oxidoreductase ResA [Planctomyces sp. SH-PL14]
MTLSPTFPSLARSCRWLVGAAVLLGGLAPALAAPPPAPGAKSGVIKFTNGGSLPGELQPTSPAGTVHWQGRDFVGPFEFEAGQIAGIQLPPVPGAARAGDFCVELASGDILFGNLVRFDDKEIELAVPEGTPFVVNVPAVKRLYRMDADNGVIFQGPAGLAGWSESGPEGGWSEDGPTLMSVKHGATLTRDISLPEDAAIEIQLGWEKTPAFILALGMDPNAKADHRQHGFRFEVWDGDLVVVRENADRADAAFIRTLTKETHELQLTVYLSQAKGELQVYGPDGKRLAAIKVPPKAAATYPGIRLINVAGDIRLENLRVTRLKGAILDPLSDGNSRLRKIDGTTLDGRFEGLDPAAKTFRFEAAGQKTEVPLTEFSLVEFSTKPSDDKREVTVFCQEGSRHSGHLDKIDAGKVWIVTPAVRDPIGVPVDRLRTLVMHPKEADTTAKTSAGRKGRLEFDRQKMFGWLMPGKAEGEGTCLVWQPEGSRNASAIRTGVAGKVVFRDPPPPAPVSQNRVRNEPQGNFTNIFLKNLSKGPAPKASAKRPQTLHLISGDTIPCTVASIDEEGLTIETPLASAQVVPHSQVKALELVAGAPAPSLKDAKRDRLLTIPRLQKGTPPTHLLHSRTGDFLRCRLIDMTDTRVRVEVQLTEVDIPRDRVSQIIWFHPELDAVEEKAADKTEEKGEEKPEETKTPADSDDAAAGEKKTDETKPEGQAPDKAAAPAAIAAPSWPLQILRRDGNRVTFFPESVDESKIYGRSIVLGECRFEIADADQLIFGQAVEVAAATLPYHQWKLHPAVEPLVAQDMGGGEDGRPAGTESALVGKPAPDFHLDLLAGGKFKLSESKGQIVVLDFWATWCGPCMQTMPLVEEAMAKFDPAQVRLVTVNLEEPAANVKAVLERHKMNVAVAMDQDGVTARKYEANAIPQTVIIDREGKIHRLFVGGGSGMVEELTATLHTLLGTAKKVEDPAPATGS